jgi:hypothetical protein
VIRVQAAANRVALALLVLTCGQGCILGVRGEAGFEAEHRLEGIEALRIDLPSTPLHVFACDAEVPRVCPEVLRYSGVWRTVAGHGRDARSRARRPTLELERLDRLAELRAIVPFDVRGTVDLEMDDLELPDDRDLEIRTDTGSILLVGSRGSAAVDVERGDVEIIGSDAGVGVSVGVGHVRVASPGHADVNVGVGDVEIEQTGGPRDLHVVVDRGDVRVTLAADFDLDLDVRAPGEIRISTPNIVAITRDRLHRVIGAGRTRVRIATARGNVNIGIVSP